MINMNSSKKMSLSKVNKIALSTLGQMVKAARLERTLSQADLAARLNVSRYTIMALERGNPKVSIGAVFEAAYIVGIPLLDDDLQKTSANISHLVTILPKRARRKKQEVDDDF
jgi:transcriptional regulator with XRE-family HTH domain